MAKWKWTFAILLGYTVSSEPSSECKTTLINPSHIGTAQTCSKIYLWGVQGSGSTFAWQILSAVEKRARGVNSLPVIKGHYLDRMVKDHKLPNTENTKQITCLVATYRDFRDILCSHARRGGGGGIKTCLDCDATSLEKSKSVVNMLGRLFSNGGQAAELVNLEKKGALILRYEDYVGCAESLIRTYETWLGVDLKHPPPPPPPASSLTDEQVESYEEWERRIITDTSLSTNAKRADSLKVFGRYNPETGIHGGHISNKGLVGGWRNCMTESVKERVDSQIGTYLKHFNYTW